MKIRVSVLVLIFLLIIASIPILTYEQYEADKQVSGTRAIISVGPSDPYKTIQAGVDAASFGDTVVVDDGTYHESVWINTTITLSSKNGNTFTTIDSGTTYCALTVNAIDVKINGFKIMNSSKSWFGVYVKKDKALVENCNITRNVQGVVCWIKDELTVKNCSFYDNLRGLRINQGEKCVVENVDFFGCGVEIEGTTLAQWNSHTFTGANKVNYKQLSYVKDTSSMSIIGTTGQIILANCTDLFISNRILERCTIGIQAGFCSDINISGVTSRFNYKGIVFYKTDLSEIYNCVCSNNSANGFEVDWQSHFLKVNKCRAVNNTVGFDFFNSNFAQIGDCWAEENRGSGVLLLSTSSCNVTRSNFINNVFHGIRTGATANNNNVYGNNFINNNGVSPQAQDDGNFNFWYKDYATGGNHWDEWTTPDDMSGAGQDMTGSDGYVDFKYQLAGTTNTLDSYPHTKAFGGPRIDTADVTTAYEDQYYRVDYNITDAADMGVSWSLNTNASFLYLNDKSGVLSGTPAQVDVGAPWVHVTVTKKNGLTDSRNFTLKVKNTNDRPAINTTPVPTATEDQVYSVPYTGIDDDGDGLTWALSTGPGWLAMSTTGILSGTPLNEDVGDALVNVTCQDPSAAYDWQEFTLTVQNTNDPPVWVNTPHNTSIFDNETYVFPVEAYDMDPGAVLTYGVDSTTNALINSADGNISWTPASAGMFYFEVNASDFYVTIFHAFTLEVEAANSAPSAALEYPGDKAVIEILNPTLTWTVSDTDGDEVVCDVYLSVTLTSVQNRDDFARVASANNSTALFIDVPLEKGKTYYWTVVPHDGKEEGACESGIWSFKINDSAQMNNLPYFITDPPTNAAVSIGWIYSPVALDDDVNDTVVITLVKGPKEMALAGDTFKWTPEQGDIGFWEIRIKAADGKGYTYQDFELNVTQDPDKDDPPLIDPVADRSVTEGDNVAIDIKAADPEGKRLAYSITQGPPWLNIDGAGKLTGQTRVGDVGEYDIKVEVTDGVNTASVEFRIIVKRAGEAVDMDLDGLPDEWEMTYFESLDQGPGDDPDGDGMTNKEEYDGNTDPTIKDESQDDDDEGMSAVSWVLILLGLLLLIVIIIVVVVVVLRSRKEEDSEEVLAGMSSGEALDAEIEYKDGKVVSKPASNKQKTTPMPMETWAVTPTDNGPAPGMPPTDIDEWGLDGESPVGDEKPPGLGSEDVEDLLGDDDDPYSSEISGGPDQFKAPLLALPPAQVFEDVPSDMPTLDEIFIIHKDGLMLHHFRYKETALVDEDILSSMLTVIQNFLSDSFGKKKSALKEIQFGEFKIHITKGGMLSVIVISQVDDLKPWEKPLKKMVSEIESDNKELLLDWNGDQSQMVRMQDYIAKLVADGY